MRALPVQAHVHKLAKSESEAFKSDVVSSVVGDGRARRVVLPTGGACGGDKVTGMRTRASLAGIPVTDVLTHHPHPEPRVSTARLYC